MVSFPEGHVTTNEAGEPISLSHAAWPYLHCVYKDENGELQVGPADLHPAWHNKSIAVPYE